MADLTQDWREFLSLLTSHRVKFVVVGGHAMAVHGKPRMTEDLDVFVEASRANARRLRRTLIDFGFGDAAPDEELLASPDKVFMIGAKPYRIDVLTRISGVEFEEAWATRLRVRTAAGTIPFLSRELLLRNKLASGRDKDLADLASLAAPQTAPTRRTRKR